MADHREHLEIVHAIPKGDGIAELVAVLFQHCLDGIPLVDPFLHHFQTGGRREGDAQQIAVIGQQTVFQFDQIDVFTE